MADAVSHSDDGQTESDGNAKETKCPTSENGCTATAENDYFKALREGTSKPIPKWITLDSANLKATVIAAPARDDIDLTIQENLIVELYSR